MIFPIDLLTNWYSADWYSRVDQMMFSKGFSYLGEGVTRRVYLSANNRYVIKIPVSKYYVSCNYREAFLYKQSLKEKNPNGIEYAPCRLIQNHVLMMRACIETMGFRDCDVPYWARFIDCHQVGLLPNGKIAAYDYGNP